MLSPKGLLVLVPKAGMARDCYGPNEGCPGGLRRFQFFAHVMSSNRLVVLREMKRPTEHFCRAGLWGEGDAGVMAS